ncbi:MBL fold metallo-hydrolase [Aquimarina algicola]|uniref:MBL fold metallo-hydrolase n=1 Tax=Aquimarina algicola TaxID=2589995 RepID=A0A504JPL8_9FLAO|nr:MBL fold metallo-hydrolase [Aquimarina algicola]TPN88739.1 MBL fold metallo-hydrolase [Aquimarina algicola]
MLKLYATWFLLICFLFFSCKSKDKENEIDTEKPIQASTPNIQKLENEIKVDPITHASAIIEWEDKTIYVDPTGGSKAFGNKKKPDLVLITDIHGDHMNIDTLDSLDLSKASLVVPQAVAEKLPAKYTEQIVILNNDEVKEIQGVPIKAIPMYNIREEALKYHNKGRGNGYIITLGNKRIYFSGDTEDIPEMRALKRIDMAFVCMNLPYTMTVESAADAVLEFKPKQVYPYHYRGTEGLSDISRFKELVSKDPNIEVVQLDWYPKN